MASPPDLKGTIDRLSTTLEKSASRAERRAERREARRDRKSEKREREIANASVPGGVFALAMALLMALYGVSHPQYWWLLFVAFGIGSGGARQLALARARDQKPSQEDEKPQLESGAHEIDALCDQLLSDLKASPEVVRAFLQNPEQTVEALRVTAKAVDQRRKDLASGGTKDQLVALEKQRVDLKARRDGSSDFEARNKFDAALRSLDGQEAALKQLLTVSDRLDGEYTSLLVLLQELKTRVAVARSTNSTGQLQGLEQNVERLNAELQAITESLVMAPIDEGAVSGSSSPVAEKTGVR